MTHLITPLLLNEYINQKKDNLVIADIRWYNNAPDKAKTAWETERIPGAIFIDLNTELSDQSDITKGRHPLPDPEVFVKMLTEKGIGKNSLIVAYDDAGGAMASRLWWMLRWIGGPEVKILDGGLPNWKEQGLPTESGEIKKAINSSIEPIIPKVQHHMVVSKQDVLNENKTKNSIVVDSRDEERYSGKVETIDPLAGHIPGAINYPYKKNLDSSNKFKSSEEIKENLENVGIKTGEDVIFYCGSGVTACHNIMAMENLGLAGSRLYTGSWSEWSRDPNLKIEKS